MASGDDEFKVVNASEVSDGGSLVSVESVEKPSLFSYFRGSKGEKDGEAKRSDLSKSAEDAKIKELASSKKSVVRDGDEMKITYDVEEPPSLLEQLKRKLQWNSR